MNTMSIQNAVAGGHQKQGDPSPPPVVRLRPGAKTSIFLLGPRGTGKSTLGIIASVNLGRHLIDFESYFLQKAGVQWQPPESSHSRSSTSSATAAASGDPEDLEDLPPSEHARILSRFLSMYSENHVVVCPIDSLRLQGVPGLFRELVAQTRPVILVSSNLPCHLEASEASSTADIADVELARNCSNYSYYNLSEDFCRGDNRLRSAAKQNGSETTRSTSPPPPRFLHLKRLEQEFVRFLGRVMKTTSIGTDKTDINAHVPLPLRNEYTYMLALDLNQLDLDHQICGIADEGLDAVELRVNSLEIQPKPLMPAMLNIVSRSMTRLRRVFSGPIIYHIELPPSGGRESPPDAYRSYLELLFHGLRLCPDYLSIDLRCNDWTIRRLVALRSATNIIGHYHDPAPGLDGWHDPRRARHYDRAKRLGCQCVRLTQVAESKSDNFALQHFIYQTAGSPSSSPNVIAYNTGPLGKTSHCFNFMFTPVRPSRQLVPDRPERADTKQNSLISVSEAQTALFSAFVYDRLKLYIVGTDVSGSLTPLVYSVALKHLGMPHDFGFQSAASVHDLVPLLKDERFGGASIAQGLKVSILPLLEHISLPSKIIGAVNTIIPIRCEWEQGDGDGDRPPTQFWRDRNHAGPVLGCYGENTDWIGMYRCVMRRLSPINAVGHRTTGLVLGAGGMARAAVYAMIQMGVRNVFVCNRTTTKAVDLANYFNSLGGENTSIVDPARPSTGSTSRAARQRPTTVHVIESSSQPWPEGFAQPTIVISCVRAARSAQPPPNFTMPTNWLQSPHGGVVVDVSL